MESTGWKAFLWGAVCALGVTVFLKAVADEIERAEGRLRRFEHAQRVAYEKRLAQAAQSEAA